MTSVDSSPGQLFPDVCFHDRQTPMRNQLIVHEYYKLFEYL